MIGMISIMLPRADVAARARRRGARVPNATIRDPAPARGRRRAQLRRRERRGARIEFNGRDASRYGDAAERRARATSSFVAEPGEDHGHHRLHRDRASPPCSSSSSASTT